MKRTLNSVCPTTTHSARSLPALRKQNGLPFRFPLSTYLSPSSFRSTRPLILITAPQSTPLSSQYRSEKVPQERKSGERVWPASSFRVRRKQIAEKSGWESGSLIAALVAPVLPCCPVIPPDRRLNYGVFFGEIVMNAVMNVIERTRLCKRGLCSVFLQRKTACRHCLTKGF